MPRRAGMGVQVKFHKGAWWVFINHAGRRRARKVGDRATANRVAQRIREQLAADAFTLTPIAAQETLDSYARAWLGSQAGNLKASTIRFYADNLERQQPALAWGSPIDGWVAT